MSDMINVSICDGKYTIIQDASGRTKLLRHGEPWRCVTGDNVILGAAYEIEKLQERIKQLEDARTVAAANSLANMLAYEDAVAKIKRLEDWKQSALEVEREWNPNAIATMLGGQLGESQREVIQREVPKLLARIKRLEELGNKLRECASQLGWTSSEDPRWIQRAEAAVEAWDKEAKP